MDGYRKIYEDLIQQLQHADVATLGRRLELSLNDAGEANIRFMGAAYLVSNFGVRRVDGKRIPDTTASALIHYILQGSRSRPAGQFVTFAELAGPLFKGQLCPERLGAADYKAISRTRFGTVSGSGNRWWPPRWRSRIGFGKPDFRVASACLVAACFL